MEDRRTDVHTLLHRLTRLRTVVEDAGQRTYDRWSPAIVRDAFRPSALNLARYLELRRHDLRDLQVELMPWGLSSLGRIEARVRPQLDAVTDALSALADGARGGPPSEEFFAGERRLAARASELFGADRTGRRVRILVTLPTDAAERPDLVADMVAAGADCFRINCAHDDETVWAEMIRHVRAAGDSRVIMDLAGPKLRTVLFRNRTEPFRVHRGDRLILAVADYGGPSDLPRFGCTEPDVIARLKVGREVCVDDGRIRARVVDMPVVGAAELEVTLAGPDGSNLKAEKGLNFPDTMLPLDALSEKDHADLPFVVRNADIIGYSFVRTPADIDNLIAEVESLEAPAGRSLAVVAKIETPLAIRNLPELIVHAAGRRAFGVMIARGDLAVEIGYERLAEIQEEILWLCEAAHVPVIWATQVLESLVKRGRPSRGEITDAAMAERAECVMLNKGQHVVAAIGILDDVLTRMQAHQTKKTPRLRALRAWTPDAE